MDDHGAADGVGGVALGQVDLLQRQLDVDFGDALVVGVQVAEVAAVVDLFGRVAVLRGGRIEVAAGAGAVRRRAVAFFVDVETVQARRQPFDAALDVQAVGALLEADVAADLAAGGWLQWRFGVHRRCGRGSHYGQAHDAAYYGDFHHLISNSK